MTLASLFTESATEGAKNLSGFTYPFTSRSVKKIMIWIDWDEGNPRVRATIYFKKQATCGEHEIKTETLEEMMPLIKHFLEELKP